MADTAKARPMPSPATLPAREEPPRPAPSPETTLSAAASSTLASPGMSEDRREPPAKRFPKGIAAAFVLAIAAIVIVRASSTTPDPRSSVPATPAPSIEAPAPVESTAPVVVASATPPATTSTPKPPPPRASASSKGLPFDERSTGAFLQTISARAVTDCSRLDGPRMQTFLVRFGKDGVVSEITPTFREPLSPAQTCIEEHFRGARTIASGVTAVSVTLQPQPGAAPGFN
jgi:hypothetical protein